MVQPFSSADRSLDANLVEDFERVVSEPSGLFPVALSDDGWMCWNPRRSTLVVGADSELWIRRVRDSIITISMLRGLDVRVVSTDDDVKKWAAVTMAGHAEPEASQHIEMAVQAVLDRQHQLELGHLDHISAVASPPPPIMLLIDRHEVSPKMAELLSSVEARDVGLSVVRLSTDGDIIGHGPFSKLVICADESVWENAGAPPVWSHPAWMARPDTSSRV